MPKPPVVSWAIDGSPVSTRAWPCRSTLVTEPECP